MVRTDNTEHTRLNNSCGLITTINLKSITYIDPLTSLSVVFITWFFCTWSFWFSRGIFTFCGYFSLFILLLYFWSSTLFCVWWLFCISCLSQDFVVGLSLCFGFCVAPYNHFVQQRQKFIASFQTFSDVRWWWRWRWWSAADWRCWSLNWQFGASCRWLQEHLRTFARNVSILWFTFFLTKYDQVTSDVNLNYK